MLFDDIWVFKESKQTRHLFWLAQLRLDAGERSARDPFGLNRGFCEKRGVPIAMILAELLLHDEEDFRKYLRINTDALKESFYKNDGGQNGQM